MVHKENPNYKATYNVILEESTDSPEIMIPRLERISKELKDTINRAQRRKAEEEKNNQ